MTTNRPSTPAQPRPQPQPTFTTVPMPEPSVSVAQFSDSYRFQQNGCDTGQHEFSAETAEELKHQVCSALQNDSLNRSCAERARYQAFQQKCPGQTWQANYAMGSPVAANAFLKFSGAYLVQSYLCDWDGVLVTSPVRMIEVRPADPALGSAVVVRYGYGGGVLYLTYLNTFQGPASYYGSMQTQQVLNEPGKATRVLTVTAPGYYGLQQTMTDRLSEEDQGFLFTESDLRQGYYPYTPYRHSCAFKLVKVQ
jgi:hypothetical protein